MRDPLLKDQIEAANAYEALHVPALFAEWPPRVLDAIGLKDGDRVLDVACGTGVLAREAASRVGESGHVWGVDLNPGMLAVAASLAPAIEWRQADATSLPFSDEAFDAVASQFGLMFFPDRRQALREMARVLARGRRVAVAVWDALDNSPPYPIEVGIIARAAGERAADALRAPFALGDRAALGTLFDSAGFGAVNVSTHVGTARFPGIRTMVEADLRGWLPVMGVVLDEAQIQRILAEAESALAPYVTADGHVVFDAPAHIVTGTPA